MNRSIPIALMAAIVCVAPARAQSPRDVQIQTQKVSDNIYMLIGQGGNIGLCVGEDGAFMIDDQFAPLTGKILEAVARVTAQPVKFLLNTHWHADHTGGNENMAAAGAVIVAHDNVRVRMSQDQFSEALGRETKASPAEALPVITFSRDVTFHFNGEEIGALHVPNAHTDGDTIVRFSHANVIHMGDTFFNGMYPFIDVDSGGNIEGIIDAADRVLQHSDDETKIIPGHGPLADRADLQAYRDTLAGVRDAIVALIDEGKSRDEVVAANPTAAWDEKWGGGFMDPPTFTGIVYDGLTKAGK